MPGMTTDGIAKLFLARSVAVVGASPSPEKLGHVILANILAGGYDGEVYPINPRVDAILGRKCYPALSQTPGPIDLAVVVVPAPAVPGVLREAAARGAGAAIIISGGFRESGRSDLEDELRTVVAETGLRLIGPNCQGINYRGNRLCASWPLVAQAGPFAVVSQSGTVAATLAGWAVDEGLGVAATVSLGNQVDVCETDLIEFFAADPGCRVTAVYLEGAKDGRRFLDAVRRALPRKPLVVLKSGRTAGGQRAAASHTRSLAGRDEVFDAACRQYGIVRAAGIEALYDSAKALAMLEPCGGNRLFVLTSSGGAGILAVDEAEKHGLSVPSLPGAAVDALAGAGLLPSAILANPLDLTVAPARDFGAALAALQPYGVADLYLVIFGDPIPGATEVVQEFRQRVGSRIAVAYLGGGDVEKAERLRMHAAGIPVFPTPERAAVALAAAAWAARKRATSLIWPRA